MIYLSGDELVEVQDGVDEMGDPIIKQMPQKVAPIDEELYNLLNNIKRFNESESENWREDISYSIYYFILYIL